MRNPWQYRRKGIVKICWGSFLVVCYLFVVIYYAITISELDIVLFASFGWALYLAAPGVLLLVFGIRAVRRATTEIRATDGNGGQTIKQMKQEFESFMEAVNGVQLIKYGATVKLSTAQLANILVNLPDAKINLSEKDYDLLVSLYQRMRKDVEKIPMNYEKYLENSLGIIRAFDLVAPYEKYSGTSEHEVSVLMEGVYGKNHKRIRELHRELFWQQQALCEIEENLKINTREYKDALTDAEVKSLVQQRKWTQNDADEYLLLKKKTKAYIESAPKLMQATLENISSIKEWIAELEE